jgi:cobalt-zinc-cadmium efflux system membrane fusion protein
MTIPSRAPGRSLARCTGWLSPGRPPRLVPPWRSSRRRAARVLWSALPSLLVACTGAPEPADEPAAAAADTALLGAEAVAIAGFTLDTARRAPWAAMTSAPARVIVDPARHQTLGAITEGRVARVHVREGERVARGQLLVSIHSHEIMDARSGLVRAESESLVARADRDAADVAFARAERLLAAQAMGRSEVDRARVARVAAEARLAQADAEVARARGLLEHLLGDGPLPPDLDPHHVLIRSPINGVVTARSVVEGAVVLPGAPLLTISDPRALQLELRLTDAQLRDVAVGSAVRFTLVGEPADAPEGEAVVRRVTPVLDGITRTTLAVAEITRAPAGLRGERFANAALRGVPAEPVVVVPRSAIQALAGDTVVIVAEPRGEGLFLTAVPVRVGRRDARLAEIVAGLDTGRAVVTGGALVARAELLKRRESGGGGEP